MLNENAREWVAALRSGDFEQGRNVLASLDGRYCCLGVACEVYRRHFDLPKGRSISAAAYFFGSTPEPRRMTSPFEGVFVLPGDVATWLGLATPTGRFGPNGDASLADLNDMRSASFAEIADVIESEPAGLFA